MNPPVDYYQQVVKMEEYGEQTRRDAGRQPDEVIEPARDMDPVKTPESSVALLMPEKPRQVEEASLGESVEQEAEIQLEPERPPQREVIEESPPLLELGAKASEPIALAPDVIKVALEAANLGINTRTVELVNGRLSGGKNSVRVSFLSESVDVIDDRFVAICAVIYHLNKRSDTVDVVAGIAEDKQVNLLAILQSNMSDIALWMTNEISRAEWFSRVTKKIL